MGDPILPVPAEHRASFEAERLALEQAMLKRFGDAPHRGLTLSVDPVECICTLSYSAADVSKETGAVEHRREMLVMVNPCRTRTGYVFQRPCDGEVVICASIAEALLAVDQAVTAWSIARNAIAHCAA